MKGVSRPKIRRNWGPIKPYTKVKPSNKVYDRKKKVSHEDVSKYGQLFIGE